MGKLIYVVEDDEDIRKLLTLALETFTYDTAAFETAEDALKAVREKAPDLLLLDIMLPKMSGLEATKLLRKSGATKKLPIILLTARGSEADRVCGLDSGADDYIVKPFSVMELGARVRSIFRRLEEDQPKPEPRIVEIGDLRINHDTREVEKNGEPVRLTFKEHELLCILVRERGRIVSREELLNEVWGSGFMGESRTMDMHIRTLRAKLQDDAENPKYIKTVRSAGYRFIGE
ncbi:MAG: response regulator transcription factor [Clostridiales bacterium]|nr:response regulator transcription factor [Clostridiales bacterium]MDR2751699.1 response regulator transcription factor [Clostridiales bacterium]